MFFIRSLFSQSSILEHKKEDTGREETLLDLLVAVFLWLGKNTGNLYSQKMSVMGPISNLYSQKMSVT